MNFLEIAKNRQSCRSYDLTRPVEQEKLDAVLLSLQMRFVTLQNKPSRKQRILQH